MTIVFSRMFLTDVLLYAPSQRKDSTYYGLCYTVLEHWLEREIAQ